jgi:hypothetical protein
VGLLSQEDLQDSSSVCSPFTPTVIAIGSHASSVLVSFQASLGSWGWLGHPRGDVRCILPSSYAMHQRIFLFLAGYSTLLLTTPLWSLFRAVEVCAQISFWLHL